MKRNLLVLYFCIDFANQIKYYKPLNNEDNIRNSLYIYAELMFFSLKLCSVKYIIHKMLHVVFSLVYIYIDYTNVLYRGFTHFLRWVLNEDKTVWETTCVWLVTAFWDFWFRVISPPQIEIAYCFNMLMWYATVYKKPVMSCRYFHKWVTDKMLL